MNLNTKLNEITSTITLFKKRIESKDNRLYTESKADQ